ncbi:glucose-1-phosphate adenylyltransferase subunit GlgD [Clostridium estertheticum]|uniref:glucose-1-phosphate adenylyltransferase subunit GlgD n=1 Tax=Clostridium estertheticum TaxID=238834 RepID=UPI001C0AA849|nr:glucose-1-phosphate adenylyltransferase subunit GlgD [Clostridium estertheticum]MBU3179402.1 glucose-1-phosphate adenylyltransferase subunit GlgD [Clostridium estertheticum]
MINNYMGILNLNEDETNIINLTKSRPLAAIPIASSYRIIDFALSNMVNSGLRNIGIFTQSNSRSLVDHVGSGRPWDLDRRPNGLFVFNFGIASTSLNDTEMLWNNTEYLYRSKEKNVILSSSYMVGNIDYMAAVKYHEEKKQDITVIYKNINTGSNDFLNCDVLNIDENSNVLSIGKNTGAYNCLNISMEMFIMKKELLISLIRKSIHTGSYKTIKDTIHNNINNLSVTAYEFNGYLQCVNSISAYYKTNMDMLSIKTTKELFFSNGPIYTKIKDEPPTKYSSESKVTNSIIADGCIIEGIVENSIISRGVFVHSGAEINNSIILQNCEIKENSKLFNVIIDKNVIINKDKQLNGDNEFPLVIEKRSLF